jgi:crotonobetainyl-CoA:carnitine CoA-transferase CaiB-like acyl-CoA transferase
MSLLQGLRVLDFSDGIAGSYATKLLADAGADVVKVEPTTGDSLRRWSASGTDLRGVDGALFRFLNASKRSVVGDLGDARVRTLVAEADVVVESGALRIDQISALREEHERLVVTSITAFGRSGPWADRPATEFTLQALCGSTASRGSPDREPLHAGGRLGEWIAGTYASLAALAVARSGRGDHVDVSMLECMTTTLGGFGGLYTAMFGMLDAARGFPGPFRNLEAPCIEPTKDGLVGFCTGTGQQFEDFLLMIDQPELRGDPRFATAKARTEHADAFEAMVREWTERRTTDDVVELASMLRIPVAPVGTPDTITTFDHFVERGVYVESGDGTFRQPRVPYRVEGVEPRPFEPAPTLGSVEGYEWPRRDRSGSVLGEPGQPLAGLRVVDFTAFWAGPSATQVLAALGADVVKIESVQRPDGMRFQSVRKPTEDQWWEHSPYFQANNFNKRGVTLDLGSARGRALALELVAKADVVIENFSPRVLDAFDLTWDVVHEVNPAALMVRMPGFGLDGPWRDRTGFAQTMEQASGMAWVTGFADGLPVIPRGPCDPLAGMHAVFALLAALVERDRSGVGRLVEVTMIEAALNVAAELVIEHEAYGVALMRAGNRGPVAAPQGVYPCAGTEQWLALAVVDDDHWAALREALGDPAWARDADLAAADGRRRAHDLIDERLREVFADRDLDDLVELLSGAGVPAERVVAPVWVLDNVQLHDRGFVERVDHPVIGLHDFQSLPFRLASHSGPWFYEPSPTLGQHNHEVLFGDLELAEGEIDALIAEGVIGDRLPS